MKKDRYARLEELFNEAVELEGELRREFLDRACGGDEVLREDVELLLAGDSTNESADLDAELGLGHQLLADAAERVSARGGAAVDPETRVPLPERIDCFRIQRLIATGGMGAVYLAEQDYPRRRVALKVIRPGVFTEGLRRRFEFEAELLGRLQHRGIAQIYEAGEAETGAGPQPFFAMEYIDGVELGSYARQHDLDTDARLELLARICDAVHHAHQKGIVHRDLKPGNILVVEEPTTVTHPDQLQFDALGQPKVLDFGVSRLVQESTPDTTQLTQTGHVVGTPAYMSPEQAGGERDLDTRADVYSLGVIGFELLSGRLPHQIANLAIVQALRLIQEQPAPRLESLDPGLRGDPSSIIGKALEPERERRYVSAAALAEDIRRHLADQPIAARPPTLGYQLSRFVRRNKTLVTAATVAFLSLVAGLVLALLSQREEARQRLVAERQTEEARRSVYAATIQAAMAFDVSGDIVAARHQVAATPADLRGWEYDYLAASFEDDLECFPMVVQDFPSLVVTPGESEALFQVKESSLRLFDFEALTWSDHPCPPLGDAGVTADYTFRGAVALLPGGDSALWGDRDSNLMRLDLEGREAPRRVLQATHPIAAIEIAPDRARCVVVSRGTSAEFTYHVLDLETMDVVLSRSETVPALDLAYSPDSTKLAFATGEDVLICDADTLEPLQVLEGPGGSANVVCFSPTGERLASAGIDRTVRVWSLPSGALEQQFGPFRYLASALAFHPDGETLLSGHPDARIRLLNVVTGKCERLTSGRQVSDPVGSTVKWLDVSSGGDLIRAVARDGVHVRPLREPLPASLRHEESLYPHVYDVAFSPSGKHLVSAGWDGAVRIWDVATGQPVVSLACPENGFWARYSPDGTRLLTCAQKGWGRHLVTLWNATTLREVKSLEIHGIYPCSLFVPRSSALLLNCGWQEGAEPGLAAKGSEPQLWIVDPLTLRVKEKRKQPARICSLALSPDGGRFVYGTVGGQLTMCDSTTLEPHYTVRAHERDVEALAFSPDSERLATGGMDGEIAVWEVGSGSELLRFDIPGNLEVFSLRFTRDGDRIFSGSRHVSIGVWDSRTGLEVVRLPGHEDYVHGLALSPDGRLLASASGDNTIRLWDSRPLRERVAEKHRVLATERAVEGEVARLIDELDTIERVTAAIEADPALTPLEKHAAWNVLQRSVLPD